MINWALSLLLFFAATVSAHAAPATQPVGAVTGKVTSEGEIPLHELVIYLESPDPARPLPPPGPSVKVSQRGAQFAPALTIITTGQTVDFPNDEDRLIEHNVFSNAPAKRFDLGLYPPGQTRSVTFDKPGAVFLYCSIHRHMDGVIFVSPTPFASRVDPDGNFKIENVPPGNWTLRTWQRRKRFPEQTAPLVIEASKSAAVKLEFHRK